MILIKIVFAIVAYTLLFISHLTGRTYKEVNIIAYYFFIPLSWLALLDIFFKFHYLKIMFVFFSIGFCVGRKNFREFAHELFKKSVDFLNYFNRFGSNYIASSVFICVVIPIAMYTLLILLVYYSR